MNYKKLQREVKQRAKVQKVLAWIGFITLIGLLGLGVSYLYRAVLLLIDII